MDYGVKDVLTSLKEVAEKRTLKIKIVIDRADKLLGGVVEVVENNQKPRTDLTCPFCNNLVYDNRHDKKSDKSPDFVCSGRSPDECSAHTGKWRKSWWLNSNDLPKEWGFGS